MSQVTPPPYESAPPAPYGDPVAGPVPGKTLGIVAFVLSFFLQLVALILGIVALVQSRRAGVKNGWAAAAIIISAVLMVVGIVIAVLLIFAGIAGFAGVEGNIVDANRICAERGPGTYTENGVTVTCG